MILTFTYGIKLNSGFTSIIEETFEKDHDISKLYDGVTFIGVPLTDEHPYFTSSEVWFDEKGICQFSPDVRKLKIKVKKKIIEEYNDLYDWHVSVLTEHVKKESDLEKLLDYIKIKPRIIFSLSND